MTDIIFATGNANKMREIREIFGGDGIRIRSMQEAGITSDPDESGSTFTENALIKARAIRKDAGDAIVMADDSGLVIDAMPEELGVHSARFMGHDTSYDIKNQAILARMQEVPEEKRTARFVCAVAAILADGTEYTAEGVMEGRIAHAPSGNGGFGYDPIFWLPAYGCTSADLSAADKNAISHRGKALREMKEILKSNAAL